MTDTATLYYHPFSRARTIHWMLEEAGAKYELKWLDLQKREQKDPAYLALNPMGKVPTLVHRGTAITEAAAICAYLADAFPEAKLAPAPTDPARGSYYRWLFWGAACLEAAIVDKGLSRPPAPAGHLAYGTYEDTLNTLEKAILPGTYLLGDRFTAADVFVASLVGWGLMTKGLEARPVFESYRDRCADRPGFKRYNDQTNQFVAKMTKSA